MAFVITLVPGTQVGNTTTVDAGVCNLLASPTIVVTGNTTDLADVSPTAPTAGQLFAWNEASEKWTPVSSVPAAFVTPFAGADASNAGTTGGVPAPTAGQQSYVLTGGGTWQPIPINAADSLSLFKLTI